MRSRSAGGGAACDGPVTVQVTLVGERPTRLGEDLLRVERCTRCPGSSWNRKNHSRRWCDRNGCGRRGRSSATSHDGPRPGDARTVTLGDRRGWHRPGRAAWARHPPRTRCHPGRVAGERRRSAMWVGCRYRGLPDPVSTLRQGPRDLASVPGRPRVGLRVWSRYRVGSGRCDGGWSHAPHPVNSRADPIRVAAHPGLPDAAVPLWAQSTEQRS